MSNTIATKGLELAMCFIFINSLIIGNIASTVTYEPTATDVKVVFSQELVTPGPNIVAISVVLTFPPGDAGTTPHFHSGPSIGYVVSGEYLFQVDGEPPRIIPAGAAFYEKDLETHIWGANASNSTVCQIVGTIFGRPGQDPVTFINDFPRGTRVEALALVAKGV